MKRSPVSASWRTRCRCENVPRSVSWPVSRIGIPSTSSVENASASAWPQSMPPSSRALRRLSSCRLQLRVHREALGHAQQLLGQRAQPVGRDRGDDLAAGRRGEALRSARARAAATPSAARAPPSGRRRPRPRSARPPRRRRRPPRRASPHRAPAPTGAPRSRAPSAAACRPARPARCGRSGGSRPGRRRRRCRSGGGRPSRAGSEAIAASGSSAFTWMIGASKPFARSLE